MVVGFLPCESFQTEEEKKRKKKLNPNWMQNNSNN